MKIEFYKHNIGNKEIKSTRKILKSIFLTTGRAVSDFERRFSEYLKCKFTVGLSSGTGALHLGLLAHNISEGDEVITTPLSFVATANSILMAGAKPVFVDVEAGTGNINADLIENSITNKTKAIMPVHLYGQMCDMQKINTIAKRHNLVIIEDAAHCIEGKRDGYRVGQLGDIACFSFYATKNITSGEGGAISTNNANIAEMIKMLRSHGISKEAIERYTKYYRHYDMEILGWKYNMDNIHASLLLSQLKNIEKLLKRREEIWNMYVEGFRGIEGIDMPETLEGVKHARHLFTIWVSPKKRDKMLWSLQKKGIGVAVNYRAIHLMKYYKEQFKYKRGMFPVTERIGDSTISLPLYPKLKNNGVKYVIKNIKDAISQEV